MNLQIDPYILLLLLFVLLLMTFLSDLISSYIRSKRAESSPSTYKIITEIVCSTSGDYSSEREFIDGDYVGKEVGTCPKCGGKIIVNRIYAIYQQSRSSR